MALPKDKRGGKIRDASRSRFNNSCLSRSRGREDRGDRRRAGRCGGIARSGRVAGVGGIAIFGGVTRAGGDIGPSGVRQVRLEKSQ